MTVLTGETGAGKSILLDALSLALGGRGDSALVRHGASQGQGDVAAVFDLGADHPVRALLRDSGIDGDGDLILRRVQGEDGRTRAFINDQPVSVNLLREVGKGLVEIHGQHDDRAMVDTAVHRQLLDAFGGLTAAASDMAAMHRAWREALSAVAELERSIAAATAEAEYLRASVDELDRLQPSPARKTGLPTAASR